MTLVSASARPILAPDEVQPYLLDPIVRDSVLGQAATTIYTETSSVHVPVMRDLDVADWIPEGQEIPLEDVKFQDIALTPRRLTGGSVVTQEVIEDSNPVASQLVGEALARDLVKKIDASFFGAQGKNPERPAGLGDLAGFTSVTADAVTIAAFFQAQTAADVAGHAIDTFVCSPATASRVGELVMTGGGGVQDLTVPARRVVLGIPVLSSPHVPDGIIWGLNRASTLFVLRKDAEVEADASVYFTSYRVAVRSRIRATWGFTNPAAVVRIKAGA